MSDLLSREEIAASSRELAEIRKTHDLPGGRVAVHPGRHGRALATALAYHELRERVEALAERFECDWKFGGVENKQGAFVGELRALLTTPTQGTRAMNDVEREAYRAVKKRLFKPADGGGNGGE